MELVAIHLCQWFDKHGRSTHGQEDNLAKAVGVHHGQEVVRMAVHVPV